MVAMMFFLILLFTAFKANDNLRVIQLNEEVYHLPNQKKRFFVSYSQSYVVPQVALMFGFGVLCFDPTDNPSLCVASACLVHLLFTGVFVFYLLESE